MSESVHRTTNEDVIPTRELEKARRKREYAAYKAQQKAKRSQVKDARTAEKKASQAARDRELWDMLKPAAMFQCKQKEDAD